MEKTRPNGSVDSPGVRAGEYDPVGQNVSDPSPYLDPVTYNPDDGGMGGDLFGSGQGYRPGKIDVSFMGMPIPQLMRDSFLRGLGFNEFDIIEARAHMSSMQTRVRDYSVFTSVEWGPIHENIFGNEDDARSFAVANRQDTVWRNILYNDSSWSASDLILVTTRDDNSHWVVPARRLTVFEVQALNTSVNTALNHTDLCKKYITDLITQVKNDRHGEIVDTDMSTLLSTVFNSRGDHSGFGGVFVYTEPHNGVSNAGNYWDYAGGPGFAEIALSPGYPVTGNPNKAQLMIQGGISVMNFLNDPARGGMTAIHELMHTAVSGHDGTIWSNGDDRDFANAAAELAGEKRLADGSDFSGYWDDHLRQACGFTSDLTHMMTDYKLYK